ncbi:MAG: M61 family peptidase [Chitinophagaceae bacterium]|nr:MAG: M61 family peptidase [Chitinophagaceae bacterium]
MKRIPVILVLLIIAETISAQKISYIISFPNIAHHEANISLTVSGLTQRSAIFRMSRSSPGRYATHEFGKNVYDVQAFNKTGQPVSIRKIDGDVYEVPRHDGFVRINYTLYANHPDGTYAGIDRESVHLNAPATFLWLKGAEKAPVDVKFNIPQGKNWTISTQLKPGNDPTLFTARDFQYLMDSPISIGDLNWFEWKLPGANNQPAIFRLSLEATGDKTLMNQFAKNLEVITKQAVAVFGTLPVFDYNTYTFITGMNPYVKGDGMEHRNSTVINRPGNFTSAAVPSVFAHEFFHAWNVERIRPASLEPFNFEKSNVSGELWFAEGFTQYYGELLMMRSGFRSVDEWANTIAGLVNTKENTAGAKRFSPVAVSQSAVFVDAGVAIDKTNYPNMFTSYYPYGAAIALALDLELRSRFDNLDLDGYMQAVWKKFGIREQPYTVAGLQQVLAELTNDKEFASGFFDNYVNGHKPFEYGPLLEQAGFTLSQPALADAWLGNLQFKAGGGVTLAANTIIGTPLYEAGLDIDDTILQLAGKAVGSPDALRTVLKEHKPGDTVSIQYRHRETVITTEVVLSANPVYTVVTFEKAGTKTDDNETQFRNAWLSNKIKD